MKGFKKVIGLLVCVVVLLGVFAPAAFANEALLPTLTVAGNATVTTVPDRALVTFSIRTLDDDPIVSQEQNREKSNEIYAALEEIGIALSDTRTQGYNIWPFYDWETIVEPMPSEWDADGNAIRFFPNHRSERIFRGYETTHTIVVTIDGVDKDSSLVGQVLDLSVTHGANRSGGVRFVLSNEKREVVYLEALTEATSRATNRAETVMAVLGINNIRPLTVNIENVRVNVATPAIAPVAIERQALARTEMLSYSSLSALSGGAFVDDRWDMAEADWGFGASNIWVEEAPLASFTPISPGETSVSASVSLIFTY